MHIITKITVWLSIFFVALIGFRVFLSVDEVYPAGTKSTFAVTEVNSATKTEAIHAIEVAAKECGCNIFKVQPDPRNSNEGRVLFAFIGDPGAFKALGGFDYQNVPAQSLSTRILPATSITTEDMRGRYVTDARGGALTAILSSLDKAEITTEIGIVGGAGILLYSLADGHFVGSLAILVLSLLLAITYSVTRRKKVRALRTLHGHSSSSNAISEVAAATLTYGIGLIGLCGVGGVFLVFYNGYKQFTQIAGIVLLAVMILYVVVIGLVLLALLLSSRPHIPTVLKGDYASLSNGFMAAGVLVLVLAIVFLTTSAAWTRAEAVRTSVETSSAWTKGKALYALRPLVAGTHEDEVRSAPGLYAVLARMEQASQVLLAHYLEDGGDGREPYEPEGSQSLLVNDAYLQRQVINNAAGERIRDLSGEKDQFTLLVPRSYSGNPQALLNTYVEWFGNFACSLARPEGFSCHPSGRLIFTAPGQKLFTYSGSEFLPSEVQGATTLTDPVVAVVSAQSELISPVLYHSFSTQDDLYFTDPDILRAGLEEQGIAGYFQGIDSADDAVRAAVALSRRELTQDVFTMVLGGVIMTFALMIMTAIYCDRQKRPMFVKLIHGYSFFSRHAPYLMMILGLSLIGVIGTGMAADSLTAESDIAVAVVLSALPLLISLIAVRSYEMTFRADLIKRS